MHFCNSLTSNKPQNLFARFFYYFFVKKSYKNVTLLKIFRIIALLKRGTLQPEAQKGGKYSPAHFFKTVIKLRNMKGNYYLSQLQTGCKFYTVNIFGKRKNYFFVGTYVQNVFIHGNKIVERIYFYRKENGRKTITTAKNLKVNIF